MRIGAYVKHWSERILSRERALQQTYASFRALLAHDIRCHELLAEFEALFHGDKQEDPARTRFRYHKFASAVESMVRELERMHPGQARLLRDYFTKYDFYIRLLLEPPEQFLIPPFTIGLDEVAEAALIGNKSRNLARAGQALAAAVPAGFTITSTAGELLLAHNGVRPAIDRLLASIDPQALPDLEAVSQALTTLILRLEVPETLAQTILDAYDGLTARLQGTVPVAVRSSGVFEDSQHSFAGQYRSILGVGRDGLVSAYLKVLASRYSPEALQYRIRAGLSDEEAAMAVLVLEMADAVASGVMYTRRPGFENQEAPVLIQSIAGLGLPLVSGETVPDAYWVDREHGLVQRTAAGRQTQQLKLVDGTLTGDAVELEHPALSGLNPEQIIRLSRMGLALEQLFGEPQDVEWATDAAGHLYLLQSRPMAQPAASQTPVPAGAIPAGSKPLLTGATVAASGLCSGIVYHYDPLSSSLPPKACILITRHLPPSLARYAGQLAGVVCTGGAVTGHFASICRELGIVLLVEAAEAFSLLPEGTEVIVDGQQGAVHAGRLPQPDRERKQQETSDRLRRNRRLWQLHDYITPLHLIDPWEEAFRPQNCKSLHDIIRYAHEKAVQIMFGLSGLASDKSSRSRLLETGLGFDVYLIDLDGGFASGLAEGQPVLPEQVLSRPFAALWQGLSDPAIDWQSHLHFDWQGFSDMALSGGMALGGVKAFATYAVVGAEYCNVNMRFGFHFTVLDCLCGGESRANYCQLRLAGGGGDYHGRSLRILLLQSILARLGFEVSVKADLLDARISMLPGEEMAALLIVVGRLLGMTKLLDMTLQKAEDVQTWIDRFFQPGEGGHASGTPQSQP